MKLLSSSTVYITLLYLMPIVLSAQPWEVLPWDGTKHIYNVHFFSKSNGIIIFHLRNSYNHTGISTTTDGGKTFATFILDTVLYQSLLGYRTYFIDFKNGWSIDNKNIVYRTSNGGITWDSSTFGMLNKNPQYSGRREFEITGIKFLSEKVGWVGGLYRGLLKTTDGGKSWVVKHIDWEVDQDHDYFVDISFSDSLYGWAVGGDRKVIVAVTTDGGESWTSTHLTNLFGGTPTSVSILDPSRIYIGVKFGQVLVSADSGKTWSVIDHPYSAITNQFTETVFLDSLYGVSVGAKYDAGVNLLHPITITTVDGGKTWTEYSDKNIIGILNGIEIFDRTTSYLYTETALFKNGLSSSFESQRNANAYKDNIVIRDEEIAIYIEDAITVLLYDITGELVYHNNVGYQNTAYPYQINTNLFSSGIYIIIIINNQGEITRRLINLYSKK